MFINLSSSFCDFTFKMFKSFNWLLPTKSAFDSEGRIQPLGVKKGELANRILSVGDPNRAFKMSQRLDEGTVQIHQSNMIFCVYTGKYHGVDVSIIATGMGFAMAELMVVQARAVVDGPLTIIRFGTCGSLHADVPIGCYAVSDKAYYIRQDFEKEDFPFEIAKNPIPFNCDLKDEIFKELQSLGKYKTVIGSDTSADTFYPSQGRIDDAFVNKNEHVIETILKNDPEALSFEMESYLLAFLSSKFPEANIRAAAVCLTLAQRTTGGFLDNERKSQMEHDACTVLLNVLAK